MKFLLITTAGDAFGGVFATSYRQHQGPDFDDIVILPERTDLGFGPLDALIFARNILGVSGLSRLLRAKYLAGLLSHEDKAAGLPLPWVGSIAGPGTNVREIPSLDSAALLGILQDIRFDVLVSVGTPVILKSEILALAQVGCVNVHNGRLPKYRGHFGTFWEVHNGERLAAVSIHRMIPEVDAGGLLAVDSVEMNSTRSFVDLMMKKKKLGGGMLASLLSETARQGSLPTDLPAGQGDDDESEEGYFAWPDREALLRAKWL